MGAPLGNKNAVGHDGSNAGRKSAYEEIAAATKAHQMFFEEQDQAAIEAKITSGKFSIADRFILTAMEGDSKILAAAHKKALPDSVDITSGGKPLLIGLADEE